MTISRITLVLKSDEVEALEAFARVNIRKPKNQARHIIREILIKEGYLHDEPNRVVT